MEKFFKLKQSGTTAPREAVAGLTTFFAMAYILFVNPDILSQTGMPAGAVFLATIFASVIGTLVMGLFANVPYAQAPGMGLNAFFTYTVCFTLGFSWQQALAMVFVCGVINIIITVTKIRKLIIRSLPLALQSAIGGGIGIFVAYIGILNMKLVNFDAGVPALSNFNSIGLVFAVISLILMAVLVVMKIPGAIFIGIMASTAIGIPLGLTNLTNLDFSYIGQSFSELGTTFGAAFGSEGVQSLFNVDGAFSAARVPVVLITIFAFSLSDTFDTLGTFIGTGNRTGIFDAEDRKKLETSSGFSSKMDKALFADSIATSIGAIFGTSNTTTYVESAAGIGAGGRTGLTSVATSGMFLISIILAPIIGIVPTQATSPALIIVGIMMMSAFADIKWKQIEDAVPAFFAGVFMAFCYSISYGIAAGFIFYALVKMFTGKSKDVHPVIWVTSALFLLNFIVLALI